MFDHDLIERHAFENIPLDRDLYLMDEKWMSAYDASLLTLFSGGERDQVGYISCAAARAIGAEAIELSWYPNVSDRFHEVRVILPRSQFIVCTECWQWDEKPRIFVRSDWLTNLHLRAYSAFMLVDAIGVKAALAEGTITRPKLIALRDKIDDLSARFPSLAFISLADSLLVKSNWSVGHVHSDVAYTYEPEAIVKLLPEIRNAYREILAMDVYAVITQGSNEYHNDSLLHVSPAGNHISLNSLGLPFAQLMEIEKAARKAIRAREHDKAEVYLDQHFFRSIRFRLDFSTNERAKYCYATPMGCGLSYYYAESLRSLLDNFESDEERRQVSSATSK